MTSNLASARQAIQAELSHARQGMAFYSARVDALETALSQLESVEGDDTVPTGRKRRSSAEGSIKKGSEAQRGRAARSAHNGHGADRAAGEDSAGRRGRRASRKAGASKRTQGGDALPTTGTDFWLQLVTEEPRSAVEIANAAAEAIGLKPDQKEKIQKLKQRVAPALATLVSAEKIRDSGAGRARRFFRGERSEM
ncbi:MAG TPA: hypothetical protein VEC35_08600 [Noviherbaspirillum sp.]|nr:hypothetical protein [Noviherbaspirillum sp.]